MNNSKTFMLIGASKPNIPIIQIAKKLGFTVVVTDINSLAAGLKYGDFSYNISAKNIEELTKIAIKHNVDCVYSATDLNFTVGVINKTLNLDGFPLILGLASEYKTIFRDLAKKANMPINEGFIIKNESELIENFNRLGNDVVIKATNLSSSKGVMHSKTKDDLLNSFKKIKELSSEDELIIEKFVPGTSHDVNGLVIKGKFYPCGIIDRNFVNDNRFFVQQSFHCPTQLDKSIQEKMYKIMEDFSTFLKIETSPVKADFLFDGKNVYLLEFGPRFHGEMGFLHMIPDAINIRAMDAYLKYRYENKLDLKLLSEKILCNVTGESVLNGNEESNYDINKYVLKSDTGKYIDVELT